MSTISSKTTPAILRTGELIVHDPTILEQFADWCGDVADDLSTRLACDPSCPRQRHLSNQTIRKIFPYPQGRI